MPDGEQLELIPGDHRPVKRVRRATDKTIAAARRAGRLEDYDDLLVALLRTNADRCDELRGVEGAAFHETQALKLQLEAEARFRTLGGPTDDAFDQLLAAAASSTPPSHPT